jgi:hypothetical protein
VAGEEKKDKIDLMRSLAVIFERKAIFKIGGV